MEELASSSVENWQLLVALCLQQQGKDTVYGLPMSGELPLPAEWPSTALCRLGALPSPHTNTLHQIFTGTKQPTRKWKTEYFVVSPDYLKGSVTTVGLAVMPLSSPSDDQSQEFTLNVGELKILDIKCLSLDERPSYIHNLTCIDINSVSADNTISLTLKWTVSNNHADPITHCNVYATTLLGGFEEEEGTSWNGEPIYLGSAYASSYRVCNMHMLSSNLKEQPFGLELRVQPVTLSRRKPSVDDADSITVWCNS
jgi:hypothetical protein